MRREVWLPYFNSRPYCFFNIWFNPITYMNTEGLHPHTIIISLLLQLLFYPEVLNIYISHIGEQFAKGSFWCSRGFNLCVFELRLPRKRNNPVVLQRRTINKARVTQLNTQRSHQVVAEQNMIEVFAVVPQNESHLSTCQCCTLCKYI